MNICSSEIFGAVESAVYRLLSRWMKITGSAFCWLSHWNVMQGYFNFSISKPLLAYVEEGGFNVKIPRRQNLPTGRNIQGRLKAKPYFQTAFHQQTACTKRHINRLCQPNPLRQQPLQIEPMRQRPSEKSNRRLQAIHKTA